MATHSFPFKAVLKHLNSSSSFLLLFCPFEKQEVCNWNRDLLREQLHIPPRGHSQVNENKQLTWPTSILNFLSQILSLALKIFLYRNYSQTIVIG